MQLAPQVLLPASGLQIVPAAHLTVAHGLSEGHSENKYVSISKRGGATD